MLYHKFKAKPQEQDGIKFASKKELKRYKQLEKLKEEGDIVFFLIQVPIRLDGGIKYVCDYQIFWSDGTVTFEDVKGIKTPVYIMKKKLVEDKYPFKIIEV